MKSKKLKKYYVVIILIVFIIIILILLLKNINNKKTIGISETDNNLIEKVIVDKVKTDWGISDIKINENNTVDKKDNIQKITQTGTVILEEYNVINVNIPSDIGINTLENVNRNN